ncbi:hypothetical protein [Tardiphaga sp.]|uniref:hypothetical protein n=1 Tax=Tardiphaga sp. TaxID=1926292 RepID=UPI003529E3B4
MDIDFPRSYSPAKRFPLILRLKLALHVIASVASRHWRQFGKAPGVICQTLGGESFDSISISE